MNDYELAKAWNILQNNKHKNFVKRILEPEKYPKLDLGNGNYATHKMAWGQVGDKYVVYPTVLHTGKELKDYGKEAWKHVKKTNNYIEFDTPEEADWFAQRYKVVWGEE